jgi:hypothetical protein
VQWLVDELYCPLPDHALLFAARGGCLEMLRWVQQRGMPLTPEVMDIAALNADWRMLQYLHSEGLPWTSAVCTRVAAGGHLTLLQQLQDNGCPWDIAVVGQIAARAGCTDIMAYVLQQHQLSKHSDAAHAVLLTDMLNAAAVCRQLAAAQWLHAQGAQWPVLLSYEGQQWQGALLEWARAEGCTSPTN